MPRLLAVNVGLPRDIEWRGQTVHTGIWKSAITGRCRARRLNLDGDGQGDLAGHGGEHRAVFVYQIESYRFWQEQLRRADFIYGQFGENFTIAGLPDDVVCIGDRFRIGSALFEVTQPRVTCYRVGIRMSEPRMPALLTSSGRPGFYFRVLQEGDVGAGDEIVQVGSAADRMTVAEINALLYSPEHTRDRLERALRIEALSAGWRDSFEALLQSKATSGNAGLAPRDAAHPAAPGFQPLTVAQIDRESADVVSLTLRGDTGASLVPPLPGQYVVLRFRAPADGRATFRSYSLSGPSSTERYRISVKIEPNSQAGTFLSEHVRVGDVLDVSAPRGGFTLDINDRPLLLLSAGIGITPVLAMLHALALARFNRRVLWLHSARDGEHQPFAAEVRSLVQSLAQARSCVCFSRPRAEDVPGRDFDFTGRITLALLAQLDVPRDADVYLCGPNVFMTQMQELLAELGVAPARVHVELFNGGETLTPGIASTPKRAPHLPLKEPETGFAITFARSGVTARWDPAAYASVLELAEACDVPVRWSCRAGVCHNCESGLVTGRVVYGPSPLDPPAAGNILICCSQPASDLVIDL
ncbi:MAG TPA: MOSC and FAD-binding oxidoreductase domain-containing protein [Steroidobacteraceae bacterium]